jgi:hypothetical protein|tara:strand:- start:21 stop:248 length:228 start_codon:yes stop_codon:yes gene_type:complete
MVKNWNKLSQGDKNYWIMVYQGHSKLTHSSDVPSQYIEHIEKIEKKRKNKELEEDKKHNPWKYKETCLGKRGLMR